ncbi:MAG: UDP-N-acetylmuramoylalanine--D-glutamate ligase [Deltaproteobacteria bacterium RIFCSPLOWO2_02_FULL_47_10]|nr:MAG: UDP-N-acetylmuramoylalanine--D-glutamate ligase [Deltaproteobacteria bacterium RIFCSPLOWO2_02_FULL_47_10]
MELKGKKLLVVGFGKSGQATAKYCLEHGANVSVTDEKPLSSFDLSTQALKHLNTFFGSHPSHIFTEADIIVVSPGVLPTLDGLNAARKKGIPIIGEMELVFDEIAAPIIAITGTNGKSTVTTLIGEILKEAGKKVLVGGNLGTPLIDLISEIDEARTTDYVVLEVSSYQLEITPSFHPKIAVLLNITPDHLDRYANYEEYINAKALIVKNLTVKDYLVYNEDDALVCKIAKGAKAKKIGFSKEISREIDISRAKITGLHNKENIIAAAKAVSITGCPAEAIQKVINTFTGLPHRNQFVREVNGVKYFDDSKGTNVGAVVKSLEGFDCKVILIAGGLDKGGSYDPLRPLIKERVKALILIGEAREKIARAVGDLTKVVMADSMAAAVGGAAAAASSGDVVLLSPACASFDMFKDYAHRGNVFIEEVMLLCTKTHQ